MTKSKFTYTAKELTERHGRVVFMTGAYWYVDTETLSHHLAPDLKVAEHVHRTGSNVLFYVTPAGHVAEVVPTHFSEEEWIRNQAYTRFRRNMDALLARRRLNDARTFSRKAAEVKRQYASELQGVMGAPL